MLSASIWGTQGINMRWWHALSSRQARIKWITKAEWRLLQGAGERRRFTIDDAERRARELSNGNGKTPLLVVNGTRALHDLKKRLDK